MFRQFFLFLAASPDIATRSLLQVSRPEHCRYGLQLQSRGQRWKHLLLVGLQWHILKYHHCVI